MIILGIDPGYGITGYGLIQSSSRSQTPQLLEAGVLRSSLNKTLPDRLLEIYDHLNTIIKEFSPESMAMEEVYSSPKFPRSGLSIGNVQGIVYLVAAQHNIKLKTYYPIQVKKALLGVGRANKMQVQKMIQRTFALETLPRPDDAADALAVALCHAGRIFL